MLGCAQTLYPPICIVLGIALTQVQDLMLAFTELAEVHVGPLLKPVKVPLDSIPSLLQINHHSAWCYWQTCWGCNQQIPLSRSQMKIVNSVGPSTDY